MASDHHLDDLLNTVYEQTEYGGVQTQSEISTPPGSTGVGGTVSSVTVTTTGAPAVGISVPGIETQYKIVSVSDTNDSVSLVQLLNGQAGQANTMNVIGFNANGVLISATPENDLAQVYALGEGSINDTVLGILSPKPITAGMNETFTKTGSTTPTTGDNHGLTVSDLTTGKPGSTVSAPYTGQIAGITSEYIAPNADSLHITASTPGWFIHGGSGNDEINVLSGNNILDGGTGSNFLTGGSGDDIFLIDDRGPATDLWSTIAGFHAGDNATIFGITKSTFSLSWLDAQGAPGETGLTLHATLAGKPTASVTFVGFSSADMNSGRLAIAFGNDPNSGSDYMQIHATS